jgi:hypothetical protein
VARVFSADAASAGVMGLIVCAAVMAAAGETGSFRDDLITVVVAALIYWVAAAYSSALGTQLVNRGSGWRAFGRQLRDQWPMVEAAGVPVVAAILARLAGASDSVAVTTGLSAATGLLFVLAWIAARGAGLWGLRLWVAAASIAALGVSVIVLKTLLHSPGSH